MDKLPKMFQNHGNAGEKYLDSFSDAILRSGPCKRLHLPTSKAYGQFTRGTHV
jgi:hypothetical protein